MDTSSVLLHILLLGLLMIGSALFSASETALSALTRSQVQRLRQDRRTDSLAIVRFLDDPRRLFITVLFGNMLVNMAFVSITGSLIYHDLFGGTHAGAASLLAILIETLVLLIFGEVTPKTYAIKHSEALSRVVARPLWFFSRLIFPFRKILRWMTDMLLPLFGVVGMVDHHPMTGEELRMMVKATAEEGALDEQEGEIIENIFELHDIEAKEAMVPRTEMVCVDVSMTIQEAFEKTREMGHSRLPVYRGRVDTICGIFYVKDLPLWRGVVVEERDGVCVEELTIEEFLSERTVLDRLNPGYENTLIRRPLLVFEGRKIGILMREMASERHQMAILLDEYGEVSGLITMEDIVEEVLGEIVDEHDIVDGRIIVRDPEDPDTIQIPGLVSLRSVNRRFKLELDESEADTLGGYVMNLFGSVPGEGDVAQDEQNDLKFQVVRMDGLRIDRVKMRRREGSQETEGGDLRTLLLLPLMFGIASAAATGGYALQGSFSIFVFSAVLVLSLILMGFYAGSETAVVSASRSRIDVLAERGDRRALMLKKLLDVPDRMLGMMLVGTNLMTTAAGQAGVILTASLLPGQARLQNLVNTVVLTSVMLVFCEILPKTIFRAKADALALRSAGALWISDVLLRPVVVLVEKITGPFLRISGEEENAERARITREELKLLATMGEVEGTIEKEQSRMIRSVIDLETRTIENAMVPLVDIVAVPKDTNVDEFCRKIAETGFSRIPIYENRVDNLVGLVNILDVLYAEEVGPNIDPFVRRDVQYEPGSRPVYSLLRDLQHSRNSMVFVVDEYGGVVGLVTMEDLVEEIMGEIPDGRDLDEEARVRQISHLGIECDGKMEVLELNHRYGTHIPTGDYETIAGYIIAQMGRIPKSGESFETDDLHILVLEADARSVRRVRVHRRGE